MRCRPSVSCRRGGAGGRERGGPVIGCNWALVQAHTHHCNGSGARGVGVWGECGWLLGYNTSLPRCCSLANCRSLQHANDNPTEPRHWCVMGKHRRSRVTLQAAWEAITGPSGEQQAIKRLLRLALLALPAAGGGGWRQQRTRRASPNATAAGHRLRYTGSSQCSH